MVFYAHDTERRSAPRHRTFKRGMIQFRNLTIECVVRNLSVGGACLVVETIIPDAFDLIVSGGGPARTCRVVWRFRNRMGIAFQ
jgi:alkyl hydroperoxide reductase subunit AhpF